MASKGLVDAISLSPVFPGEEKAILSKDMEYDSRLPCSDRFPTYCHTLDTEFIAGWFENMQRRR
jgi:hypothetical protein